MKSRRTWLFLLLSLMTAGCGGGTVKTSTDILAATQNISGKIAAVPANASPTIVLQKSPTPDQKEPTRSDPTLIPPQKVTDTPIPEKLQGTMKPTEPGVTPDPNAWQQMPVIPQTSNTARQIYEHGLEMGSNPHSFSKVGDCGSTPSWFLGDFDRGPKYYSLGDYQYLSAVIQQFAGSFGRTSLAAKSGFNASSVFTTLWADRSQCKVNETPLACEYRLNQPSIALITLGTNDVWHQDVFESKMRAIIEFSIQNGVLPVLATKADNDEGDGSINATIVRLADEYDIPLWNYWRAVQSLPDQGLQPDGAHITWGPNRFDDPQAMKSGWAVRNLTALQTLDAVWRGVTSQPTNQP